MKKCPDTLTGKHKWIGGKWQTEEAVIKHTRGGFLGFGERLDSWYEKLDKPIWHPPFCEFCGLIDDRPTKRRGK